MSQTQNLTNIVPLDGGGFAGGTITWPSTGTLPTLAVGATLTVQFQANVISPTAVGTDIFNTGTISADQLPTPAQTNTTVHTVTGNPVIAVVKTPDINDAPQPLTRAAGETVDFIYLVTNGGNVDLENVVLTDNLEGTPAFVGGDTGLDGILSVGETWTYGATHTVTQAEIDAGVIGTNVDGESGTATVTGVGVGTTGLVSATDPGGVTLLQTPGIAVTKVADVTAFSAPGTATYTYTVNNTGNVTLTNIVVTDDNATPGNAADDFNVTLLATTLAPRGLDQWHGDPQRHPGRDRQRGRHRERGQRRQRPGRSGDRNGDVEHHSDAGYRRDEGGGRDRLFRTWHRDLHLHGEQHR